VIVACALAASAAGCGDNGDGSHGSRESRAAAASTDARRQSSTHYRMVATLRPGNAIARSSQHLGTGAGVGAAQ
jgi:hypothetical protein